MKIQLPTTLLTACLILAITLAASPAESPCADIRIRVEHFTVPPATGPLANIRITNPGPSPCTVTIEPRFPQTWQATGVMRPASTSGPTSRRYGPDRER